MCTRNSSTTNLLIYVYDLYQVYVYVVQPIGISLQPQGVFTCTAIMFSFFFNLFSATLIDEYL